MLLVPTYYGLSKIHGIGVFAKEPIKQGTVVWEFREGFDFLIKESETTYFPIVAIENLKQGSSLWNGTYCVFGDHSRFINHSNNPNLDDDAAGDTATANKDIERHEELTEDYRRWLTVMQWTFYFPDGVK